MKKRMSLFVLLTVACAAAASPMPLAERLKTRQPFFSAHRGWTPEAPENSLPAFTRAGELGFQAIETDVRLTADGVLVCCHDGTLKRTFGVAVDIAKTAFADLRTHTMSGGSCLRDWPREKLLLPTFDQYLDVCAKYDSVPFIETKGPVAVVKPVLEVLEKRGLLDVAVLSSIEIAHIREARRLSRRVFVHHIFTKPELLDELAAMGNAGVSFNYSDPTQAPQDLLDRARKLGLRYCLRAADTAVAFAEQKRRGCDYFPTNKSAPGGPLPFAAGQNAFDPKGGHVQGIAASAEALYVAQMTQLVKLDWTGRPLKKLSVISHTGDIAWHGGELYTAVAVYGGPNKGKGMIQVFDKDLNLLRETLVDRTLDGIACLDGILYVGMGAKTQPSKKAHRVNVVGRFDAKTLKEIAPRADFDYGYQTHYGFQNITTDGEFLYGTFYAVKGAPGVAVFDRNLRVLGTRDVRASLGFDVVPFARLGGRPAFVRTTTRAEKTPKGVAYGFDFLSFSADSTPQAR